MKTISLSQSKLKNLVETNRKQITNINGVEFGESYPIIEVSQKHTTYYDVATQENKFLQAPYIVSINE